MSNMSYCRFENTARDLEDCSNALEEMINDPTAEPVNRHEMDAAPRLFDSAAAILSMLAQHMGASITVTDSEGGECDLEDFDWAEAFAKVQKDLEESRAEDEA